MAIIRCNFCGRSVIQALDISVCINCLELGNDAVKIYAIKQYLEKNPGAKYKEIMEALNIDQKTMDRFLKEGSLQIVEIDDLERIKREERSKKLENFRKQVSDTGLYNNRKSETNSESRNYYDSGSQLLRDLDIKREQLKEEEDFTK